MPTIFGRDSDIGAQMDLDILMRADEIKRDSGRLARARGLAERTRERMENITGRETIKTENKGFNNAVQGKSGFKR